MNEKEYTQSLINAACDMAHKFPEGITTDPRSVLCFGMALALALETWLEMFGNADWQTLTLDDVRHRMYGSAVSMYAREKSKIN